MTGSWADACLFRTLHPGPDDAVVVIFVNGRYVTFRPVADYERLRGECEKQARAHRIPVKLLPLQPSELMNLLGAKPGDGAGVPLSDADRQAAIQSLREALVESDDRKVREEARGLLTALGERA